MTAFMPHLSMLVNKYKDYVTNGLYKHISQKKVNERVQIQRSGVCVCVCFFKNYRLIAHLVLKKSLCITSCSIHNTVMSEGGETWTIFLISTDMFLLTVYDFNRFSISVIYVYNIYNCYLCQKEATKH